MVEAGSITAAAEALGLPRPTLSRRLARLEERLDVRLIRRTTRRLALTREGDALYARARPIVRHALEAEATVRRLDGVPRGRLRCSIPTETPQGVFPGWVADFMTRYPEVDVEMVASSEHVDLVGEGFDVAMRVGPVDDTSLIARTLTKNEHIAVASPTYLRHAGTPTRLDELSAHECILGFRAGTVPEDEWPTRDGGKVRVQGRLASNQMGFRLAAARHDVGIAFLPDRTVREDLTSGALVCVLADEVGRTEHVRLVYPEREYLDPKVEAFVEHIASSLQASRQQGA